MLNSLLFGPFKQIEQSRDVYIAGLKAKGTSDADISKALRAWGVSRHIYVAPTDAEALSEAKAAEMWYQKSLAQFLVPANLDTAPSSLRPQFQALEKRLASITWEQLVRETVMFGSPDRVADQVREM